MAARGAHTPECAFSHTVRVRRNGAGDTQARSALSRLSAWFLQQHAVHDPAMLFASRDFLDRLALDKCSRRIRPIVSTTSIPHRPLMPKQATKQIDNSAGQS
jgi:hypothetical protein